MKCALSLSAALLNRNPIFQLLYDSLKARIATQRIPERVQTQLSIGDRAGNLYEFF